MNRLEIQAIERGLAARFEKLDRQADTEKPKGKREKIQSQLDDSITVQIEKEIADLSVAVDLERGVWPRIVAEAFHSALGIALKESPKSRAMP